MASMDSSAAKLLQHPPPQAAELPAPREGGGRLLRKHSGQQLRALAVILLLIDYIKVVVQYFAEGAYDAPGAPLPWRRAAIVALAYAAVAALIWFLRRLERRRLPEDHDACWDKWMKLAAHILTYAIVIVLIFYSGAMTPCAVYIFLWVGPRDHVYLGIEVLKEESDEKQYEAIRCGMFPCLLC